MGNLGQLLVEDLMNPILIILIIIVYKKNIRSDKYVIYLLCITVIFITLCVLFNSSNNNEGECLIGDIKKNSGVLFGGCVDVWHLSHFLLWVVIGLLSPGKYKIAFVFSVFWEILEHFCLKNKTCFDPICLRFEDIVLNMLGYCFGTLFRL